MNLAEALSPLLGEDRGTAAFVGAGGKTSALFRLANALVEQGRRVLLTTTTHLRDPRLEPCRPPFTFLLALELEAAMTGAATFTSAPGLTVLLSRPAEPGKLKGLHPSWLPALGEAWEFVLVEADGSKGLPLKAPAAHEPVLPAGDGLVVGVLGLDGLGQPMDARTVHRPEIFSSLTGCAPGAPVTWEHLAALIHHPQGLFKGATGPRALLLNKVELASCVPGRAQLAGLPVDRVLIGSLEPLEDVMVFDRGVRP